MDEPTAARPTEPAHQRVLHGLADALHRLGEYELELRTWERLDALSEDTAACSVAAACSAASLADYRSASAWLERAKEAGAPPERILEIRGRILSRHDHRAAVAALRRSLDSRPTLSCLNALALLHVSAGDAKAGKGAAREAFRLAFSEDTAGPSHWSDDRVDALVNAVLLKATPDANQYLGPALMLRTDRADLHELWSRATVKGRDPACRTRRSLRSSWSGLRPAPAFSAPVTGAVRGTCAPDGFTLDISLTRNGQADRVVLVINDGYTVSVRSGGDLHSRGKAAPDRSLPVVGGCSREQLTWWQGETTAHLTLRGRPRGGARFREDLVEVDGLSGWLPVTEHVRGIRWSGVHIRPADGWELQLSEPDDASWSPGFVMRLREGTPAPSRAAAATPAMVWFDKGMEAWSELVGPADRPEPVVVRADSTFCYTRPRYVRIPSGLLDRPDQWPVLAHEAGHLWWGRPGQFEHEDAWIAEGLAEFTLHLLEDARPRLAYRKAALHSLGTLAAVPLAELWNTRQGPDGMAALRVKAGFFMSMLREALGEKAFRSFLCDLLTWSESHPLDTFTVMARASSDMIWFGEQWIHRRGTLKFGMKGSAEKASSGQYRTSVDIEMLSDFTPGAPLCVELELRSGARHRQTVRVETGQGSSVFLTNSPPVRATLDPDSRWLIPEQPIIKFSDDGKARPMTKGTPEHAESK